MFVELALRRAIAVLKNAVATSLTTASAVLNLAENAQSYVVKWLRNLNVFSQFDTLYCGCC